MTGKDTQLLIKEMQTPSGKRAMMALLEQVERLTKRVEELERATSPHAQSGYD